MKKHASPAYCCKDLSFTSRADPALAYVCGREENNGFLIHEDNDLTTEEPLTSCTYASYQNPLQKHNAKLASLVFRDDGYENT